jgi:Uncharacterized lipoprotein
VRARMLVAVALIAAGCASARGLDVTYPATGVNRALLASAEPRRVALALVSDRRRDARIGTEPESKKDIVTRRPASEIVREALALELDANGHTVTSGPADAVLAATVEEFRLDIAPGYESTQYVGKVVIALAVTDGRTGDRLLDRRYVGTNRRLADPEAEGAPRETMDTALARAMHDLATDPELVRALARASTAAR